MAGERRGRKYVTAAPGWKTSYAAGAVGTAIAVQYVKAPDGIDRDAIRENQPRVRTADRRARRSVAVAPRRININGEVVAAAEAAGAVYDCHKKVAARIKTPTLSHICNFLVAHDN